MLHDRLKSPALAALLLLALALAGCTASRTDPVPVAGICDPDTAQRLVSKARPTDADAMRLTGATIVRQIAPGQPVLHDLRQNRVTIETDPATGRVVRATCG